jgi:hypothetical protein
MALERNLSSVPPVLLTATGSTNGVVQVTDTAGFYVKQQVQLQGVTAPKQTFEIKRVVDSVTLWVGKVGASMDHNVDVSAYTIADGAFIFAEEQLKAAISKEVKSQASYEQEPLNAWRTKSIDQYGNGYDADNPLPVNIFPASDIPFTLGTLALPSLISQYVASLTFDQVNSDAVGSEEVIRFYNAGSPAGELKLSQTPGGWVLNLGVPEESFFLLENGSFFELESGLGGFELE